MKRSKSMIAMIMATVLCFTAVCPVMGAETADEAAALNGIAVEEATGESDAREEVEEPDELAEPEEIEGEAEEIEPEQIGDNYEAFSDTEAYEERQDETSDKEESNETITKEPVVIEDTTVQDGGEIQEGVEESVEIIEPEQAEVSREAMSDDAAGEFIAQAIWTEQSGFNYLTFYYGAQVSVGDQFKGGTVTDVWSGKEVTDTGNENPGWIKKRQADADFYEMTVTFDNSFSVVKPTSTHGWFSGFDGECTRYYNFQNLDTSKVTDMSYMFKGCWNNWSNGLDTSSFDTSNVTNMSHMFEDCMCDTDINMSGFDTSKVTDMSYMFAVSPKSLYGSNIPDLEVIGRVFDTSNVTNMSHMFVNCFMSAELLGFDTSNVTDMSHMFEDCDFYYGTELGGFDTSKVTNMSYMFASCDVYTGNGGVLDLSSFDTSKVTDMSHMFEGSYFKCGEDLRWLDTSEVTNMSYMLSRCRFLEQLDVSELETSKVTNMSHMFSDCNSLKYVNASNLDTSKVTDMSYMFDGCQILEGLDVSSFDTSNVTDMKRMFGNCYRLTHLNTEDFDTSEVTAMSEMFEGCVKLASLDVSGFDTSKVTDMSSMFKGCDYLDGIDVSGFKTSKVTNMSSMFSECKNLTSLSLKGADTSKVTDMSNMFYKCDSLRELNISGINTSKVTNMSHMFDYCDDLSYVDVSGFNTSQVTDMSYMFNMCERLENLDVSGFNTSQVTDMSEMFAFCEKMKSLDLIGFNTSKVTKMTSMFHDCKELTELDVSGFDLTNVADMSELFYACAKLKTLYCSESTTKWRIVPSSSDMFYRCASLVGKDGNTEVPYNYKKTDVYMAKAAGLGGYFTPKGSLRSISDCTVNLSGKSVAYTGKKQTPAVEVYDGTQKLAADQNYKIQYENNINIGTAKVIIKGIGIYTGTVTKTFMIILGKTARGDMFNLANNVKVTWKEVPGAKYYKVYRSGVKDPVIVTTGLVGWDKEPGLVNGQKYTYKIVASLTDKTDSSGDSNLSYSKVMYRLKTVVIRSVKNTAPGKVTVKYDKTTSGDSYVLQYCERQDMVGAKTKVVLGSNSTSYTIGGLKKGKTYYISIRVRKKVNGIDYYTTFGVPKKITITQ